MEVIHAILSFIQAGFEFSNAGVRIGSVQGLIKTQPEGNFQRICCAVLFASSDFCFRVAIGF